MSNKFFWPRLTPEEERRFLALLLNQTALVPAAVVRCWHCGTQWPTRESVCTNPECVHYQEPSRP